MVVKLSKILIDCYLEEIKRFCAKGDNPILFSKRLSYDVRSCFHNALDLVTFAQTY